MRRFHILYLLVLFVARAQPVSGQDGQYGYQVSSTRYSVENGMASREVYCGIQDPRGFLWFGTRYGLNRFDGQSFQTFTKDRNGLAENKVVQLACDRKNHLFLLYGTTSYGREGLSVGVMDLVTQSVSDMSRVFGEMPFDPGRVYWLDESNGEVYFLLERPFQLWKLTSGGFRLVCEMQAWDELQKNVAGNSTNLFKLSAFRNHFSRGSVALFYNPDAPIYIVNRNKAVVVDATPQTLIGLTPGGGILTASQNKYVEFGSDGQNKGEIRFPEEVMSGTYLSQFRICSDEWSRLILNAEKGAYLIDGKMEIKVLDDDNIDFEGFGIYSYFRTAEGLYWLNTLNGLYRINIRKRNFSQMFLREHIGNGRKSEIRNILKDEQGNIYCNIWNEVVCHKKDGNYERLFKGEGEVFLGMVKSGRNLYTGGKVISEFNLDNAKTRVIWRSSSRGERIWSLDSIGPRKLLIGLERGVYTLDLDPVKLKPLIIQDKHIPVPEFVYRFIQRRNGSCWIVAQNGLFLTNIAKTAILTCYSHQATMKQFQLPFHTLYDAYEAKDGRIWFASNGEGLFCLDQATNTFNRFTRDDGFPSDILYRIEPDGYGNLWVSTDNGLVKFNIRQKKVTCYTEQNGIPHNEFNRLSSFGDRTGILFFGGLNGLVRFDPAQFASDTVDYTAPVELLSFMQFESENQRLTDKTAELLNTGFITVHPGDHFFNIRFRLLDFDASNIRYAYRIEGLDSSWIYMEENSIRIGGLPYGNYVLHIRGRSGAGEWSSNELTYRIIVKLPVYSRTWFKILMVILLASVITWLLIVRNRRLSRSSQLLEKMVSERTDALNLLLKDKESLIREIHHRVKNNLQVIIGLLDLQSMEIESKTVQNLFAESKGRIYSIALVHYKLFQQESYYGIELKSFTKDLFMHNLATFKKPNQDVSLIMDEAPLMVCTDTAVPLGVIINELITNSIKYAFKDFITANITITYTWESENKYIFVYRDNGVGIPRTVDFENPQTLGIRLIKLLTRQIGGTVEYRFNNGSEFTISYYTRNNTNS